MRKESGAIGSLKSVGGIATGDGLARMTAYRAGLSARDWGTQQRLRLDAGGSTLVKPTDPACAPVLPEHYELPLCVTLAQPTRRSWSEARSLVEFANKVFLPAGISLAVVEHCEGQGQWIGPDCPFGDELDHDAEWLHIVLQEKLPKPAPVLLSCGRCCLVPDTCDERRLAQTVAQLLGSAPVSPANGLDRLMSLGHGLALTRSECAWLRAHAGAMLGFPYTIRPMLVPIWVYQVESPPCYATRRTQEEFQQGLRTLNLVYEQAGLSFRLHNWCHLQQQEMPAECWRSVLKGGQWQRLEPVVAAGGNALHLFLLDFPDEELALDPARHIMVLCDAGHPSARAQAHHFGTMLGLASVSGPDQLMCRDAHGFRLSPREILQARSTAAQLTAMASPLSLEVLGRVWTRERSAHQELVLKLKIHLVRGAGQAFTHTREQAEQWLQQVNVIWAPAGIRLEAVDWSEPVLTDEMLAEATITASYLSRLSVFDPKVFNLFWVHKVPAGRLFNLCHISREWRMMLVAERFYSDPPPRNLARAVATLLGLKLTSGSLPEHLVTYNCVGTTLTADQVELARTGLQLLTDGRPVRPERAVREVARMLDGRIEVGVLPDSEFVSLRLDGFQVWLTQAQVCTLRNLVQEALCQEGEPQWLGQLAPQPLLLRFYSGHDQFHLIFEGCGFGGDMPLSLELAAELADRLARSYQPACPPLPVRLAGIDGDLMEAQDGQEYPRLRDFCQIYGPDEECLDWEELRPGDEVLLWLWQGRQVLRVAVLESEATNAAMVEQAQNCPQELERLHALAALGQRADRLLTLGQLALAEVLYGVINNVLYAHGQAHAYLFSKLSLGFMLLRARQGNAQAAYEIWMKEPPDMPFGVGVELLEQGQVSPRDYAIYRLVCAWLYALGPTPEVALERMDETMDQICRQAPAELQAAILDHWLVHLTFLFPDGVPDRAKHRYTSHRPGERAMPVRLEFPHPDRWRVE